MNADSTEEILPLSSSVVDPLALAAEPRESSAAPATTRPSGLRTAVPVLAPVVAAGGALLVHWLLPVRQLLANGEKLPATWMDKLPAWQRPYPQFLAALLALT